MIEILIVSVVILAVLLFGCICALVKLRDKTEIQDKSISCLTKWCADLQRFIHGAESNILRVETDCDSRFKNVGASISTLRGSADDIKKIYGDRLDLHRDELNKLRERLDDLGFSKYSQTIILDSFHDIVNRIEGVKDNLTELSGNVSIIDGIQDEELCFAEDTAYGLGLLYDHLGLTIKVKEKKNGDITKKVVEVK
jgi:hypothetical protein